MKTSTLLLAGGAAWLWWMSQNRAEAAPGPVNGIRYGFLDEGDVPNADGEMQRVTLVEEDGFCFLVGYGWDQLTSEYPSVIPLVDTGYAVPLDACVTSIADLLGGASTGDPLTDAANEAAETERVALGGMPGTEERQTIPRPGPIVGQVRTGTSVVQRDPIAEAVEAQMREAQAGVASSAGFDFGMSDDESVGLDDLGTDTSFNVVGKSGLI